MFEKEKKMSFLYPLPLGAVHISLPHLVWGIRNYVEIDKLLKLKKYRGSLPYATFGTGKNLHKPKIALGKYLANAIFDQFISLLRFS